MNAVPPPFFSHNTQVHEPVDPQRPGLVEMMARPSGPVLQISQWIMLKLGHCVESQVPSYELELLIVFKKIPQLTRRISF